MRPHRKPAYTIAELARMLDIEYKTLDARVRNCEEKPKAREIEPSRMLGAIITGGKRKDNKWYELDVFIDWHNRNWVDNGRANKKTDAKHEVKR